LFLQKTNFIGKGLLYGSLLCISMMFLLFSGCGNVGNPFGEVAESQYIIEHINPADNGTDISVNTLITIAFPVDIDTKTLQPGNIILQKNGASSETVTVVYDVASRIATVRPSHMLTGNSRYEIVTYGITSVSGVTFASQTFHFFTGNATPAGQPEILAVTPLSGQEEMVGSTIITVTFSEEMNRASIEQAFHISNGVTGTFNWAIDNKKMTFIPGASLPSGTTFSITILK